MPLVKGSSHEAIRGNIKELVKSGRKPKQAVAIALAEARKHKMAGGGLVEIDDESDEGSHNSMSDMGRAGHPDYPLGDDQEGLSEQTMSEERMAEGLQKMKYAANDNTHDFTEDAPELKGSMSEGGLVQEETADRVDGNRPDDLHWINDGTSEPMSSMPIKPSAATKTGPAMAALAEEPSTHISKEAMDAIAAKRAKRKMMR